MSSSWPFVTELIELETTPSTSDHARSVLAQGGHSLRTPFAIRARRQTHGRGRGTNRWWSGPGSLAVTLVLDPRAHGLRDEHLPCVALTTAVALVAAIERVACPTVPLGIRWPNDVEAAGKKLAGILPEPVATETGNLLLVGLGVNVTTDLTLSPPDVAGMATSVTSIAGRAVSCEDDVLRAWLEEFPVALSQLAARDPALARRWSELDTLKEQTVRVLLGGRTQVGRVLGIDADGGLRMTTSDQGELTLFGGQVLRSTGSP